jgi:anti-sigma regulatory factor (Ser/Thr protein kinase)
MIVRGFPRAVGSLPALVGFVRDYFASQALNGDQAADVDLVIEELFTNMVRHARGGHAEIEVGLDWVDGLLTVIIRDHDVEPWNPDSAPPPDLRRPAHERRPGGLGIHLVRQLTESLAFDHVSGTTTVTVTMRIAH